MSFTVLAKPAGMVTQMLIAGYFGAGQQLDAYTFALFPISFLFEMSKRTFSAVAIPQLTKLRTQLGESEFGSYQNSLILLFYVPVALTLVALIVFPGAFVGVVGKRLPAETADLAMRIMPMLSVAGFLACGMGLASTLLNLNKYFRVPAAMPLLQAVSMAATLAVLHRQLGIWALPVGFGVSKLAQAFAVGFQLLLTRSFTWVRPHIPRREYSQLWGLSWMILVSQGLLMVNAFVDKWFATGLAVGSISSINYAMVLVGFGQQLFSMSLIVVMFTRMSEYFAAADVAGCNTYVRSNLVRVANFVVPFSLAFYVVSPELIRVLFQRGAFDVEDTVRTSGVLSIYMLGLPALVINGIVTKIYQSLQRMREKVWLAVQYILTNIIGNYLLVKTMGILGLAISSTLAINLHLVLSLIVLWRFRNGLQVGRYIGIIGRAYLMAVVAWGLYTMSGAGAMLEGFIDGRGFFGALALGILKSLAIFTLYGLQVVTWFRFLRGKN